MLRVRVGPTVCPPHPPRQWNQRVLLPCVGQKINLILPMVLENVDFSIHLGNPPRIDPNPLCPIRNDPRACSSEVGYSILFTDKEEQ